MKLLLFDTETTGLPKSREPAAKGPNNWPHLVSIAWIVMENDVIIDQKYFIIQPEWEIPEESIKIHGITQENAIALGLPLRSVLTMFLSEKCDLLVAHNMNFDFNVLVNAILWDSKLPYPVLPKTFCTMESSRSICKFSFGNGRSGFKSPKLSELYRFILRKDPIQTNLHNSLYDVQLLVEVVKQSTVLRSMMGLNNVLGQLTNVSSKAGNTLTL